MFASVRDARISSLGFWDAIASASCDPMLFGEIPVMTTVDVSKCFDTSLKVKKQGRCQSNVSCDLSNGVNR